MTKREKSLPERHLSGRPKKWHPARHENRGKSRFAPAYLYFLAMVEGIMPSVNGDIEKERRIAFVAMSRAMKLLYLSWPISYLGRPAVKSSFIGEAMEERQ